MTSINADGYLRFLEALFELGRGLTSTLPADEALLAMCRDTTKIGLDSLRPRYSEAIQKYYGLDYERQSYQAVADSMGVTLERVRQIVLKGLGQLRNSTTFDQLALTLNQQGCTNECILKMSERASYKSMIDAVMERVQMSVRTDPGVLFLVGHKVGCSGENPCPTCRALKLFKDHGIAEEMQELLYEWQDGAPPDMLDLPINLVVPDLSVRTKNCLKNENIVTMRDLTIMTEAEMLRTPNFGRKSLNELKERLEPLGLRFDMEH